MEQAIEDPPRAVNELVLGMILSVDNPEADKGDSREGDTAELVRQLVKTVLAELDQYKSLEMVPDGFLKVIEPGIMIIFENHLDTNELRVARSHGSLGLRPMSIIISDARLVRGVKELLGIDSNKKLHNLIELYDLLSQRR